MEADDYICADKEFTTMDYWQVELAQPPSKVLNADIAEMIYNFFLNIIFGTSYF